MNSWRRNFLMVWLAQFLSFTGFAFAMPFAPYYLQELGVVEPAALKLWVALFAAACPLTMAIFSPIWGALSDRYGRRIMLLRANLGGMVVLGLMGLAPNAGALIFLRLMQGIFSGNVAAAQALVAAQAPRNSSGMALGSLNAAVFSGNMVGAFFGGGFAELFGYRWSFLAAAAMMGLAVLLTIFGTTEEFTRPPPRTDDSRNDSRRQLGLALPILILIMLMVMARQFTQAWMPLLVQELNGGIKGAALITGILSVVAGVAGAIAGPVLGRLADRMAPPTIGKLAALGSALMMVPAAMAQSLTCLAAARFGAVFASGGLDPVFQIWLTKVTPARHRGVVFGWSATARSAGLMLAPLVGGLVATGGGVRSVFWFSAVLYLLLIPAIHTVVRRIPCAGQEA